MRILQRLGGLGASLLCVSSCWAATLDPIQGEVWINHGQGYQRVDSRLEAKVGDSVMVSPNGQANIGYADGCNVALKPLVVHTIASLSPCTSGSLAQQPTGPDTGPDYGMYAVGAVVVGAGVAAGVLLSQKSNNPANPASP